MRCTITRFSPLHNNIPAGLCLVPAALLALVSAGCGAGGDQPTEQDYEDVAKGVGYLVSNGSGGEVASLEDTVLTAQGTTPEGLTASGSGAYEGTRGGFRYEYALSCLDAQGNEMAGCNETTDSATASVSWSGDIDLSNFDLSISRTGSLSVSGLQSEVAVFDGEGTFEVMSFVSSLDGSRTRRFDLYYAASYDGIRWNMLEERVEQGTIRYQLSVDREIMGEVVDGSASFDMTAEVIFDGSGTAELVLDGDRSYDIELGSGTVTENP